MTLHVPHPRVYLGLRNTEYCNVHLKRVLHIQHHMRIRMTVRDLVFPYYSLLFVMGVFNTTHGKVCTVPSVI